MDCKDCGASNLDGAERCSGCGSSLLGDDGGSGSQRPTGAQNSTLLLGAVVAVAAVIVVAMLMSSGTGGSGGGGTGESVQTTSTDLPTQEYEAIVTSATAIVAADYPEFSETSPTVTAGVFRGQPGVSVTYHIEVATTSADGSPTTMQRMLILYFDQSTGEVYVESSL